MAEPNVRHLPPIPPFDLDDRRSTVGHRFEEWCELVDLHIAALGITNDARKKAVMLSIGGLSLINVTKTIDITPREAVAADNNANPPVIAQPGESAYDALKRALKAYFNPLHNVELNRLQFSECNQSKNESLDQFCARLRRFSLGCNFADVDAAIKSQFLKGMRSLKLKQTGYEKPNLTLQNLLDKGRAQEAAKLPLQHLNLQEPEDPLKGAVNRIRGQGWFRKQESASQQLQNSSRQPDRGPSGRRPRVCPCCGGDFHIGGIEDCTAKDKICYGCNQQGHLANMCQTTVYSNQEEKKDRPSNKGKVAFVEEEDEYDSSDLEGL